MTTYNMSGRDFEGQVVQNDLVGSGWIPEGDVSELNVTKEGVIRDFLPTLQRNGGLHIDVLKHSPTGRKTWKQKKTTMHQTIICKINNSLFKTLMSFQLFVWPNILGTESISVYTLIYRYFDIGY